MTTMTVFEPLGDRVLVLPDPIEDITKGGIIIPDLAKDRPHIGTVRAVGPGKRVDGQLEEVPVKFGDRVMYGKYVGTDIVLDGVDYIITTPADIMGIVRFEIERDDDATVVADAGS